MRVLAFAGCVLALTLVGCGSRQENAAAVSQSKVVMSYDEALTSARSENKPVLLVAYQTGLDKIESNLLNDPAVKERSGKVITAKLDAGSQGQAISQLGITQYPAILILRSDGSEAWRSRGIPMPGEVALELDKASSPNNP